MTRDTYTSCWINGLAIVSILSAGQIKTTAVPLQTTSPRFLVSSVILKGSSEATVNIDMKNQINYGLYQTRTCMQKCYTLLELHFRSSENRGTHKTIDLWVTYMYTLCLSHVCLLLPICNIMHVISNTKPCHCWMQGFKAGNGPRAGDEDEVWQLQLKSNGCNREEDALRGYHHTQIRLYYKRYTTLCTLHVFNGPIQN